MACINTSHTSLLMIVFIQVRKIELGVHVQGKQWNGIGDYIYIYIYILSSVQFSSSVVSNTLQPHEL